MDSQRVTGVAAGHPSAVEEGVQPTREIVCPVSRLTAFRSRLSEKTASPARR